MRVAYLHAKLRDAVAVIEKQQSGEPTAAAALGLCGGAAAQIGWRLRLWSGIWRWNGHYLWGWCSVGSTARRRRRGRGLTDDGVRFEHERKIGEGADQWA